MSPQSDKIFANIKNKYEGLSYYIDETTNIVTIYNNTCNTCELFSNQSNLELNVGINFQIICNQ